MGTDTLQEKGIRLLAVAALVFPLAGQSLEIHDQTRGGGSSARAESLLQNPAMLRENIQKKQLLPIIRLLKNGQRKQAKLALARILTQDASEPNALDLAGTILLEEKNYTAAEDAFRRALQRDTSRNGTAVKLGVTRMLLGDTASGEKILLQTLHNDPDQPLALRYMAWLETRRGNLPAALRYLQHLNNLHGRRTRQLLAYQINLAALYNQLHRPESTIGLLRSRIDLDKQDTPMAIQAAYLLAGAYLDSGNIDAGRKLIARLKQTASPKTNLDQLELKLARASGEVARAKRLADRILKQNPDLRDSVEFELARTYFNAGDTQNAIEALNKLLKTADATVVPSILRDLAIVLLQEKKAGQATTLLRKYSEKYPASALIARQLSEILLLSGDDEAAARNAKATTERFPDDLEGWLLAGRIAEKRGQPAQAREYYRAAAKLAPNDPDAWIGIARTRLSGKEPKAALETLNKALGISPGDTKLLFERASLLDSLGKTEQANQDYRNILVLSPDFVPALSNLAENYLRNDQRLDSAHELASRAYRIAPENPYVADVHGWSLYKKGDSRQALPVLKSAAARIDDNGIADFHVAMLLADTGDKPAANRYASTAIEKGLPRDLLTQLRRKLGR